MTLTTWLQNHHNIEDNLAGDIREMANKRGNTCISIIIPTHRTGQDRQGDRVEVQKAISAVKQEAACQSSDLLSRLDDLVRQIDFKHNKEGIGLFVSSSILKLIRFPFPVTKKILIGNCFHLHDLLYTENYCVKYYLLDIS